jgi:molecular chaperone DnaK
VTVSSAERVSLGGKDFPSCVAVTADGQVLGEPARWRVAGNREGTAMPFKRVMAQRLDLPLCDREFTPGEMWGFLLQKINRDVEVYRGEPTGSQCP